jgi:hypothetical protein
MTKKLLTDETRSFKYNVIGLKPILHVLRVRAVELDPGTIGVIFSQNRIPKINPNLEVINPGRRLEDCAHHAAYLAVNEWGFHRKDDIRWFIHYAGLGEEASDVFQKSTFDEIHIKWTSDDKVESVKGWTILGISQGRALTGLDLP